MASIEEGSPGAGGAAAGTEASTTASLSTDAGASPRARKSLYSVPDRICHDVVAPCMPRLTIERLYDNEGNPRVGDLLKHLVTEGRLECSAAIDLVSLCREILLTEPNLLTVTAPVHIVGDLHGQFYDFVQLLNMCGMPADGTQYLFLGDYVDRGIYSCEIVFMLAAMKVAHPERVFLLRGNHESRTMSEFHNFKTECVYKYNAEVYAAVCDMFDALPIAAVAKGAAGDFLCVHGGISPELTTLAQIEALDRVLEVPAKGAMCDLLWSDPIDDDTASGLQGLALDRWKQIEFLRNSTRGCSFIFGATAVRKFLAANSLTGIIRAHECQEEGYKEQFFFDTTSKFPLVTTVFSAPNYCDRYGNKAAVLLYDGNTHQMINYLQADHPFGLPDFLDAFTWSFPFIIEKVSQFFYTALKLAEEESDSEDSDDGSSSTDLTADITPAPEIERARRPSLNPEGDIRDVRTHSEVVLDAVVGGDGEDDDGSSRVDQGRSGGRGTSPLSSSSTEAGRSEGAGGAEGSATSTSSTTTPSTSSSGTTGSTSVPPPKPLPPSVTTTGAREATRADGGGGGGGSEGPASPSAAVAFVRESDSRRDSLGESSDGQEFGLRGRRTRIKTVKRKGPESQMRARSRSNVVNEMFRSRGSTMGTMMRKAELERIKSERALAKLREEEEEKERAAAASSTTVSLHSLFENAKKADLEKEHIMPMSRHYTL